MLKKHVLPIAVAIIATTIAAYASIIAPDGRPYRQIVLEDEKTDSVRLAASELQSFLKQIAGAELPIVSTATDFPVIYVGANQALKEKGMDGDALPSETWVIKTGDDFLALYGQDYRGPLLFGDINPWRSVEAYNSELKLSAFGATGTLTAVYEFLHRVAGVRFYMPGPDGTVVPEIPEFKLENLDISGTPRIHWRWAWMCMLNENTDTAIWSKRLGYGGDSHLMMITHSYRKFKKYKDAHPEYFALVDGKRAFGSECVANGEGHLCLTNPDVINQWAEDICQYFKENPEIDIFPLGPEDGLNRTCECENCLKELRMDLPRQEQYSYHIWNFTQKVAKKVAERYPNKYVGALAYEHYRAPSRELGEMKNVAVSFSNWRSRCVNPQEREKIHAELEEWSSRCDRLYLWNWYLDHWMPMTNLPIVSMRNIQRELTWLYANPKFMGEFSEAEGQNNAFKYSRLQTPGMQHLDLYFTGRMYLDPASDADEILAEYCRLFYGPAEKPMLAFWAGAQNRREEIMATNSNPAPEQLFPQKVLQEFKKELEAAVAATEEGSVYRRRVMMIKNEFDVGASRLIRMEIAGQQKKKMPIIHGFADLDNEVGDKFSGIGGEVVSPATWMYTGRDRQFMYFRFICFDEDMSALRENVTEKDDNSIWMDDCIELHFFPDETKLNNGYHLILNSAGTLYDSNVERANVGKLSWDSQATYNITKEDNRWIVDIKVPFAAIGINDPNFTGNILANFYRNRTRGNEATETTCWNPTSLEYTICPEKFGILVP